MPTAAARWSGSIRCCCCAARWPGAEPSVVPLPPVLPTRRRRCRPASWSGDLLLADEVFVTGVGPSTTYPDYKPAPFIVSSQVDGVDMVTVVTEGIFSYCSLKVKIDTDRLLGPEQANVRCKGEVVGHVTTAEYGSQMLSLGGVHHLTGGSKKEGRVTMRHDAWRWATSKAVEFTIDGGSQIVIQAGRAPIVNGVEEQRMRVGCGSATIGIFAKQLFGQVDEVVVVDDHITGVLTEHQAGRCLDMRPSGIKMRGRKSTPGRYFQVANPGTGWGGTDIADPLSIIESWDAEVAWPGLRLLMTSTTGEHAAWYVLDDSAAAGASTTMPAAVRQIVERIGENCEPSLSTVLFLGGAGGSLRAGVTENPVLLTRAIKDALVNVTCGGAPAYVWPGGGITVMVDVHAHAGQQLRHRAHAGHRRAHRVQHEAGRLPCAGRPHGPCAHAGRGAAPRCLAQRRCADCAAQWTPWPRRQSLAAGAAAPARLRLTHERRPTHTAARRPLAFPARPDRHRHRRRRRARRRWSAAHEAAWLRFRGMLAELVPSCRCCGCPCAGTCALRGPVARRMWQACQPYHEQLHHADGGGGRRGGRRS